MSTTKIALKAAKASIDAHRYEDAIEQAKEVLSVDGKNYNANVFLGLAYEKRDQYEASEAAYRKAIQGKDKDPLAWQGLVNLYEKAKNEKLEAYHDAALVLAEIYMEKDDRDRCQTVLDKYTNDAKKYGSRAQLKHSLEVYLPGRPLYDYLEGRIPQPGFTYARIADLVESEEKEKINSEIGQRRTRLGAKIDQVTSDVKREVLEGSQLEDLYAAVIDWTHEDEVRRQFEEKLLQRAYNHLAVLQHPRKEIKRAKVQKLAEGLVILKHPFLLAWKIKLEWSDVQDIKELDVGLLGEYISMFPDEGLSKVLRGYLESDISPFPKSIKSPKNEEENGEESMVVSAEDRLILMTEGLSDGGPSGLAHRLMGLYYLHLEEYESAVATARRGRDLIQLERNVSGLGLLGISDAMNITLATALVQYQAPRYHPEATDLFESILRRSPGETSALLGIGLILEEQEDYAGAVDFLSRALARSADPKIRAEAAWCKALNGDEERSQQELELCLLEMEGEDTRTKTLRSQTLYRIGMCQWNRDATRASRKSRDGAYARFLASLQADMNFAPAYTSLGIYYADYGNDRKRARKCFQKAFELSSSEVEAAERLAKSFAKSAEWDLVEVVAQRAVESGKVKPAPGSKKKAVSWPFAALGVVQLNNQEYAKSIVSFQSALRTAPADYYCWVGLGESYYNSGRFIAATKALGQAQKVEAHGEDDEKSDVWFSYYLLANVRRELGEFESAISGYEAVLKSHPTEYGVSIALLQTLAEEAWHSVELGFFGRAADAAKEAIKIACNIVKARSNAFNLWKAIGDVCSVFTYVQAYAPTFPRREVKSLLETDIDLDMYDVLEDLDGIGQSTLQSLAEDQSEAKDVAPCLQAAILAHKRAIHACFNDPYAKAVAWYNLGWTEHRAQVCGIENGLSSSKKRNLKHIKASVQCFKRAIELEAGNAEFWNSLGIVTSGLNPKISQHAFVRSLYLNDKNARVWTNLGAFYLAQGDHQLANDAFTRAQSSDPDYAQAWVGQGILASQLADSKEARTLFTHGFEIADSSSTMIKRQYAVATFDQLASSHSSASRSEAIQPLFALRQLRSQIPSDLAFRHLSSLFAERVGDSTDAITSLELVASELEAEYERSESSIILLRFSQAKADLGRAQLAHRSLDDAAENAETAISLSDDESLETRSRQRIRLSAHMTAGLAYYFQGSMDKAISMFRSALEETESDPDIICLLARMLWAKGGEEERNVAREQLFDCVGNHPGHVDAITLLGAIAVMDEDQDTAEAVITDLRAFRTRDDLHIQQQNSVSQLLTTIAAVFPSEVGEDLAIRTEATAATMLAPSRPHGWAQLAEMSGEPYPTEMAVLTAKKAITLDGNLDAIELSRTYAGTRRIDDAQRAVMVAPFVSQSWESFAL